MKMYYAILQQSKSLFFDLFDNFYDNIALLNALLLF
jgi:hypothetical protein